MALGSPMAMGLTKGHKVTKNVNKSMRKPRHNRQAKCLPEHTSFVQDVIREVCGFVP